MNTSIKLSAFFLYGLLGLSGSLLAQHPQLSWVKHLGTNYAMYTQTNGVDMSGNVYTAGYFYQTVDFDPGAGIAELSTTDINGDAFISKLNANGGFVWAKRIGGNSNYGERIASIAMGSNGSFVICGIYSGTVDFDPDAGVFDLTSSGAEEAFVAKYDSNGALIWAKSYGGASTDRALGVALDGSGNVFTTGFFHGTADFDPGPDTASLSAVANSDIYVLKLDADGNYLWAKSIGGTGYDSGFALAVDANGAVYTTGYFNNSVDFNPGAGNFTLSSKGYHDAFILKLDSDGNFVWAYHMGSSSYDIGYDIKIDAAGQVYASGYFNNTIDFDPGAGELNLTSFGNIDIYVVKLDPDGSLVWAKQLGGSAEDFVYAMDLDAVGNVYTTGYFWGTADFDPGAGVQNLTPVARRDFFISVISANGQYVYAQSFGGIYEDDGYDIAVDTNNNVVITGGYYQAVDFDPGAGVYTLNAGNYRSAFIQKLYFQTLGVDEFDQAYTLTYFPNPTRDAVEIDFKQVVPKGQVQLLDLQGRILHEAEVSDSAKVKLELAVPAGIYFIHIHTSEGDKVLKLVKE